MSEFTTFYFNVKTPSGMIVEMSARARAMYMAQAIIEAQVGKGKIVGVSRIVSED